VGVGSNIFYTMLHNNFTGMSSVDDALKSINYGKDFTATFQDWAMANYFGNGTTISAPANNPEWSYISINTWPGTNNNQNIILPGLLLTINSTNLTSINQSSINSTSLSSLKPWSLGYYSYTPAQGASSGTVTWRPGTSITNASFINGNPTAISPYTLNMLPNTFYQFQNTGYLINSFTPPPPFPSSATGDTVIHTAIVPVAAVKIAVAAATAKAAAPHKPSEVLEAMNANPAVSRHVQETGKPYRAYVDFWFKEKEKALRAQGIRPPF
jgi:hypothetical protein